MNIEEFTLMIKIPMVVTGIVLTCIFWKETKKFFTEMSGVDYWDIASMIVFVGAFIGIAWVLIK